MSLHKALVLFNCSYTPLFNSSADRFSEEWFVTKCLIFVCGNDVFQVKLILDSTSVSFHSYPSNTPNLEVVATMDLSAYRDTWRVTS